VLSQYRLAKLQKSFDKMICGIVMKKFLRLKTAWTEQLFVRNPELKVGSLLKGAGGNSVTSFHSP